MVEVRSASPRTSLSPTPPSPLRPSAPSAPQLLVQVPNCEAMARREREREEEVCFTMVEPTSQPPKKRGGSDEVAALSGAGGGGGGSGRMHRGEPSSSVRDASEEALRRARHRSSEEAAVVVPAEERETGARWMALVEVEVAGHWAAAMQQDLRHMALKHGAEGAFSVVCALCDICTPTHSNIELAKNFVTRHVLSDQHQSNLAAALEER
jgi:hypothetical protein